MNNQSIINNILKKLKGREDIPKDNLIRSGFLDSFDMIKLVDEIARECNVTIDGKDITEENFNSVKAIAELVEKAKTPQ